MGGTLGHFTLLIGQKCFFVILNLLCLRQYKTGIFVSLKQCHDDENTLILSSHGSIFYRNVSPFMTFLYSYRELSLPLYTSLSWCIQIKIYRQTCIRTEWKFSLFFTRKIENIKKKMFIFWEVFSGWANLAFSSPQLNIYNKSVHFLII